MIEYLNVEEYEFVIRSFFETNYLVGCAYENCENRHFHRFVYRCVNGKKLINVTKSKEGILQVSLGYREFVTEYDGLKVKILLIKNIGFIFGQTLKLTMKFYSNLKNIKIDYYLKHRIPIMHRQLLKTITQNPENVKTHCIDRNSSFHFAIRNLMIKLEIDFDEN